MSSSLTIQPRNGTVLPLDTGARGKVVAAADTGARGKVVAAAGFAMMSVSRT